MFVMKTGCQTTVQTYLLKQFHTDTNLPVDTKETL